VEGVCNPGDILYGFSTSGNSKNICNAFEVANNKEIITVGFTGKTGGMMKEISKYLINVPSTVTPRIQESHIMAGHIICELAEEQFFKDK
jgi:D-sedoheptulose 7-phosphate isomerase